MSGPELCLKCKGLHYRNSPCIVRVTKSTAARKDVQRDLAPEGVRDNSTARVDGSLQGRHLPREDHKPSAGTQALPVDTTIKRPVGRPKTITDMKAYKAAKAREYRAKAKNANS